MKLQEQLDALTADLVENGKIPAPLVERLVCGIREVVASGKADGALKAGDSSPSFTLLDANGTSISSVDLLARGPLVISFYRGAWCPYCNLELQALEQVRSDIEARGASLVAISMQNAANTRKSALENHVSFPLLVDTGGMVADKFGIRHSLSCETIALYQSLGNNLDAVNGESSWALPMPACYVIGQDGVIAFAEVNPDHTRRAEPSNLVLILDSLARAAPS